MAAALILCLGATVALVLSIGYGRSAAGTGAGFAVRYITLPAPLLSAAAFAWILCGDRISRVAVPAAIALVLAWANYDVNTPAGAEFAVARKQLGDDLMAEVRAGTPPGQLVERWNDRIYPDRGRLYYALRLMALMNLKPFDDMPSEARDLYTWWMFNLPPLSIEPPDGAQRRFINGGWEVLAVRTGTQITFEVPQSLFHLEGKYGVPPSWQKVMTSDGVRGEVLAHYGLEPETETIVDRVLDPLHVPEDRAIQYFTCEVKPLARKREIVLRVSPRTPVADGEPAPVDWVFFGDTNFSP